LTILGPIGGWLAAAFIVGTTWTLNHGVGLIYQSGAAWIDMAWSAFIGLFVASALSGDDVGKGIGMIINAILGGILVDLYYIVCMCSFLHTKMRNIIS